jgi:Ca2+/Na+ antiporter
VSGRGVIWSLLSVIAGAAMVAVGHVYGATAILVCLVFQLIGMGQGGALLIRGDGK